MQWNCVRVVRVDNQKPKLVIRCIVQRQSRVAEHDFCVAQAILHVREVAWIAGNALNLGINFVESPMLPVPICRQRLAISVSFNLSDVLQRERIGQR